MHLLLRLRLLAHELTCLDCWMERLSPSQPPDPEALAAWLGVTLPKPPRPKGRN